jgi:hypothetical protein
MALTKAAGEQVLAVLLICIVLWICLSVLR